MSPKVESMSFVGGNVPAELAERLKQVAKARDRSVSYELRRAIEAYVEAHEADKANGGLA